MYNFLKNREIGLKPRIGDEGNLWKTMYKSIAMFDKRLVEYGGIFNLEFSPDGSILVAATERKSVLVYDPITYTEIGVLQMAHNDCVNCVKFLDERIFATCSDDSTVALWDTRNLKKVIRRLRGHSNWVKNIEYAKEEGLLVTSGFDGSIFTWDMNSYTEEGLVYEKVFHTSGLMRCRLTSNADRLVISTTGGYLIIVHDLDLKSLALDLSGFRPNIYRLMQMGRQLLPTAVKYNHLFVRKRNRVELVSDFPQRNDAEVISSLQIHPQGWCALSRNVSYDESSEWTCVHDIQSGPSTEFEISGDADEEDSDDIESELINPRWHPPSTTAQTISRRRPPPSSVHAVQASSTSQRQPHRPNLVSVGISPQSYADVWVAEISMHHRFDGNFDNAVIYGINSGISAAQAMALMQQSSSDENRNERGSNLAESQLSCDLVPQQVPETHASLPRRRRPREREEFDRDNVQPIVPPGIGAALLKKIQMNTKHMLYYVQEPNKGRGFIKELCFSHDGRIICSPYDRGVRLLAFNDNCLELSETLEPNGMPKQLVDLMQTENHSDIVISSKFSPREPLLVSGCLQGELVWYKPVL